MAKICNETEKEFRRDTDEVRNVETVILWTWQHHHKTFKRITTTEIDESRENSRNKILQERGGKR